MWAVLLSLTSFAIEFQCIDHRPDSEDPLIAPVYTPLSEACNEKRFEEYGLCQYVTRYCFHKNEDVFARIDEDGELAPSEVPISAKEIVSQLVSANHKHFPDLTLTEMQNFGYELLFQNDLIFMFPGVVSCNTNSSTCPSIANCETDETHYHFANVDKKLMPSKPKLEISSEGGGSSSKATGGK